MRWLPTWSWRRLGLAVGGVVALLAVAGLAAVVAPPFALRKLEAVASEALKRPVAIGRLRFNPYTASVIADSVWVRDLDGDTLAAWRHLELNLSVATLASDAIVLDAVVLDGLRGRLAIRRSGALAVADIVDPILARPSSGAVPEVRIGRLRVTDTRFAFDDSTKAPVFSSGLGPLALSLDDFSSRPDARNRYGLTGTIGRDETFTWSGTLQVAPFRSEGEVRLANFAMPTYQPYWGDLVRARLRRGRLTVAGRYVIDLRPGARTLRLSDGALSIADLAVAEGAADDAPVALEVARFDLRGVTADAVTHRARVGAVVTDEGRLTARRGRDNVWNLARLAAPASGTAAAAAAPAAPTPAAPTSAAATSATATTATPWRWQIDTVRLARWAFAVRDEHPARPVALALRDVSLRVLGAGDDPSVPLALDGAMTIADSGGAARWSGRLDRARGTGALTLALDAVDLRPLDPYLAPYFDVAVTRGRLAVEGTATFARPLNAPPAFGFTGDFRVDDFAAVESATGADFLRFTSLRFARMRFDQAAEALTIGQVSLERAALDLSLAPDGSFSVDRLRRRGAATDTTAPSVPPAGAAGATADTAAPLRIVIGALAVRNGRIRFTDRTVQPAVRLVAGRLDGTFGELSSDDLAHATFDVRARVDNVAPLEITGRLAPLNDPDDSSNVAVRLRGLDLLAFEPYSRRYGGYAIRRGQGAMDVQVRIAKRQLDAKNVLTLDGFRFGEKVESPDATAIPLKLVFAILRDRRDRIVFDVPVQGSLDDPSFSVWRVVGRAAKNVALALVESPFRLLGSLIPGRGPAATPLDHAEFAPGAAELSAAETARLATLATTLAERPDLQLVVEPWADDSADPAALRRGALERAYRAERWAALRERGNAPIAPDSIVIEAADWDRWIRGRDPAAPAGPPAGSSTRGSSRATSTVTVGAAATVPPPFDEVLARVLAAEPLAPADLEQLATDRARVLRDALINRHGLTAERVRIAEVGGRPRETPRGWVLFKIDVP